MTFVLSSAVCCRNGCGKLKMKKAIKFLLLYVLMRDCSGLRNDDGFKFCSSPIFARVRYGVIYTSTLHEEGKCEVDGERGILILRGV